MDGKLQRAGRVAAAAAVAALATAGAANAGTVVVVTSFPKEMTTAYKTAFERVHPDINLEILNKNTISGLAYLRELPPGQRPEVFWVSAPDAFEVLKRGKLLERVSDLANPAVPQVIAGYPINDPEGFYLGQAIAGYGVMWNTRYLAAHKLKPPAQWSDLATAPYFSHVAMSSPSRSGTTHLTVEALLQGEGWNAGWSQLLRIGANCSAITERSFGVPDGVNNGQFGIGLVVDFHAFAGKYSGFPVDFAYPSVTAVVPANIALVAGSKNPAEARKFIAYSLSREGQELLALPQIARLPVLPASQLKLPAGYPDGYEIAKRTKGRFDAEASAARYYLVTSLFDQTVTFRHAELQAAARAIYAAEAALAKNPDAQAAAWVREARELAFTPVVSEAVAANKDFIALFAGDKKNAEVNMRLTGLEGQWSGRAQERYALAQRLAEQARSRLGK